MANYVPTTWRDHIVDANGNIVQQGTALSARNMNNIEQGIVNIKQKHQLTTDDGIAVGISGGENLDNYDETGFYMGSSLMNAPDASWFYIETIKHNDLYSVQKAYRLSDGSAHSFYMRRKQNGVWSAWSQDLFTSVDNGKWALRTAIIDKGGTVEGSHPNSFVELETAIRNMSPKARGTGMTDGSGGLAINGLNFTANLILIRQLDGNTVYQRAYWDVSVAGQVNVATYTFTGSGAPDAYSSGPFTITSTGISLGGGQFLPNKSFEYIVFSV